MRESSTIETQNVAAQVNFKFQNSQNLPDLSFMHWKFKHRC